MANASSGSSSGIGFTGLLAILFVALKLTGVVSWSWFWVLSPIWISVGIAVLFLLFLILIAVSE